MKSVAKKIRRQSLRSTTISSVASNDMRKPRADGVEARERLLHMALRLFAEKGFSKTSTREIAQAADVNIAAIKYYFGDKAGLYRAAFIEPMGPCDRAHLSVQSHLTLRESLEEFFASFLMPLQQGDLVQLCIRLHFREMLEPTGMWSEEIDNNIKPAHAALIALLLKHMGVSKADDDIHRLAFSIVGLALQIFISRDVIEAIRPRLIGKPAAIELWAMRLADYAEAMIAAAMTQRAAAITTVAAVSVVRKSVGKKKKT